MTNLSVTLRAQTKADNLVAGFTDFVDDRYYSGLRVTGGVRFAGGVSVDRGQQVRADLV